MTDVFVSHSTADRLFVENFLIPIFKRCHLTWWVAEHDLHPTDPFLTEITGKITDCQWFIVVMSENAQNSKWVVAETTIAFNEQKPIIPVRVDSIKPQMIHPLLAPIHFADFSVDKEVGKQSLTDMLCPSSTQPIPVIAVLGAKGGVGKSTIACRMSEMIAETGHNVLLIDMDFGVSGTTAIHQGRGIVVGAIDNVYDIANRISKEPAIPSAPDDESPRQAVAFAPSVVSPFQRRHSYTVDVTPPYLLRRPGCGKVLLLPAVPQHAANREPAFTLIQRLLAEQPNVTNQTTKIARVVDELLSVPQSLRETIDVIVIDCGAENADFNPLIIEVYTRALLTFVVAQPDPGSRIGLDRLTQLLKERGLLNIGSIRVIVNRVVNQVEAKNVLKVQFAGYQVAGVIPDDEELFKRVQRGELNFSHAYDKFSLALSLVMRDSKLLPPEIIPSEHDLWVRATVDKLVNIGPENVLKQQLGKLHRASWAIALILGLALIAYAVLKILDLSSVSPDSQVVREALTSSRTLHLMVALVGVFLIGYVIFSIRYWMGRIRLIRNLEKLFKSKPDPREAMGELLIEMSHKPDNFALMQWLRASVANTPLN